VTLYTDDMSRFAIGSIVVPGKVQSVELPEREIIWNVQQGVAGIGAATIFRGVKLIETVKVTTLLAKLGAPKAEWDQAVAEWVQFMRTIHPSPTLKPPAWDVDYPAFRILWPPLGRMSHKANKIDAWKAGPPVTAYTATLTLIEYKPLKLAKPGPPDPAQIDSRDIPPRDAEEVELQELTEKAKGL
jgi:hypothetical protein